MKLIKIGILFHLIFFSMLISFLNSFTILKSHYGVKQAVFSLFEKI